MNKRLKLYERSEVYKFGWVHGFYSCGFQDIRSDDGYCTDDLHSVMGVGALNNDAKPIDGNEAMTLYRTGYAAGRNAKDEGNVRRLLAWYRSAISAERKRRL